MTGEARSDVRAGWEVRVALPVGLQRLCRVRGEVRVRGAGSVTQRAVFDALEAAYPMLAGTLRDRTTARRRPYLRLFACEQDFSFAAPDDELPAAVAGGEEPLLVVGAIAGG